MMQFIIQSLCSVIQTFNKNYEKIKANENEKLMIQSIKKAYDCVNTNVFCAGLIYGLYNIIYLKDLNFLNATITLAAVIITLTFTFTYTKRWLENALKKNQITLATNIYLGINTYISMITLIVFFLNNYSEADMGIGLVMCIYWLHHYFSLIPGNVKAKILLYLSTSCFLFILCRPKLSYAVMMLIGNVIGFSIQLYLLWEKHHDFSKILNHIESEKNMNDFLLKQFPKAVFILNDKLDIIKTNNKGDHLLLVNKVNSLKHFAEELKTNNGDSLFQFLEKAKGFQNLQFFRSCNEKGKEKEKYISSASEFVIDATHILIVIIDNITEIINENEKIVSEKYQNILLFSASHEIRSQLNLISGSLDTLEKTYDPYSIRIAKSGAKILEVKINLLIDFIHIIMGKFTEHKLQFSLRRFVEDVCDIAQLYATVKNNKFFLKFRLIGDIILLGDYNRMFSIVLHIALNSIKYTTKGFVKLFFKYKDGQLYAIIKDNGIGMNKETLEKINNKLDKVSYDLSSFDLNNLSNPSNNKFLAGIGLLSSSMICKMLGGNLILRSEEGKGTKIKFKINCSKICDQFEGIEDESCYIESSRTINLSQVLIEGKTEAGNKYSEPIRAPLRHISYPQINNLAVLIVDDLPFNRITLRKMLEILQLKDIYEAENGKEAVNQIGILTKNYHQISVFMDIEMPIMNGIEATIKIRELHHLNKIKIVMLSAFNSEETIRESMQAGADDFFVKPMTFKKLRELKQNKTIIF